MEFKDYYEILGVARGAAAEEIKRAYRRLARKYHPDVSKEPDAEARFKEVREAYTVLKDPEKRKAYDQFGKDWKSGQDFEPPPDWGRKFHFSSAGFTDAGGFSDFFDTLFGGAGPGAAQSRPRGRQFRAKGRDVDARIRIPIEDAFRGATRQITIDVPELDSGGRSVSRRRSLNVRIPKGVTAGQRIRLEGQGGAGTGGGDAGDFYLALEFEPHKTFRAHGRDVYVTLPITPAEAALGRTVSVPTLGGAVDLKIPAGSRSGQKLRLNGRGLPGTPAGDQYVELQITLPPKTSEEARELYKELERVEAFDPRVGL
jgi:curved DNA-binding protein